MGSLLEILQASDHYRRHVGIVPNGFREECIKSKTNPLTIGAASSGEGGAST